LSRVAARGSVCAAPADEAMNEVMNRVIAR
jgi:hypothetical protein